MPAGKARPRGAGSKTGGPDRVGNETLVLGGSTAPLQRTGVVHDHWRIKPTGQLTHFLQ